MTNVGEHLRGGCHPLPFLSVPKQVVETVRPYEAPGHPYPRSSSFITTFSVPPSCGHQGKRGQAKCLLKQPSSLRSKDKCQRNMIFMLETKLIDEKKRKVPKSTKFAVQVGWAPPCLRDLYLRTHCSGPKGVILHGSFVLLPSLQELVASGITYLPSIAQFIKGGEGETEEGLPKATNKRS